MNRRVLSAVAAALVICAVAACKKKPTDPDKEPSPSFDEPNQVAWVTASATPGCAGSNVPHSWQWAITIKENGGANGLTVNYVDWSLDGAAQPRQNINTALNANGTIVVNRVVCHGDGVAHTVVETLVSTYKGQQSTYGNTVTLLARPR